MTKRLPARLRPMAMSRPAPIALSRSPELSAFAPPAALERWNGALRPAAAADENNVITIYDVIGEDWWTGGGITVNRIDAALRRIGPDRDVEVHVNSPGGDMFEGVSIFNRLLAHRGKVTIKVMGLAASAASIIAMAGDEIQMGPASFIMIHNCWVLAVGDRNALSETAATLDGFDLGMAEVYRARTGQDLADIRAWMDAETWLTGQTAVERGFATEVITLPTLTEDPAARAQMESANAVRLTEIQLCQAGMSRAAAQARIRQLGASATPGQPSPKPVSQRPSWMAEVARFTAPITSTL